jgi:IclR family acetate operon transcriptional repressor
MTLSDNAAVKSAGRTLELLELLAGGDDAWSFHAIGQALDIPASSLSQLLSTLSERGFVEHVDRRGGYRAGPALKALADRLARKRTPNDALMPLLQDLCETLGESASINVLDGDETVVTAAVHAEGMLMYRIPIGGRAPLYAVASGKAILAASPDDEVEAYIARTVLDPITPATVRTPEALREEIIGARADGFGYSRGQTLPGVIGISHVMKLDGRPVGGMVVGLPEARLDAAKEDLIRARLKLASLRAEQILADAGVTSASELLGPS